VNTFPVVSIRIKKAEKPYFRINISKKEIKHAVDRNTLKRRIRFITQQYIPQGEVTCFVKKGALLITFTKLQGIIQSQL